MPRIAGVNIPNDKRIEVSLTYVYGIGPTKSKAILNQAGISLDARAGKLVEGELDQIRQIIDGSFRVEGDLRREVAGNIKRLRDISAYRGLRHAKGLPVHGQKTKTNARTRKGKKMTMGSGRKTANAKT